MSKQTLSDINNKLWDTVNIVDTVLSPPFTNFINLLAKLLFSLEEHKISNQKSLFEKSLKTNLKKVVAKATNFKTGNYFYKYGLLYKSEFFTVTLYKSSLCKSLLISNWLIKSKT